MNRTALFVDYFLESLLDFFLFFIHDHVTGATKIEEYVPEIRPNISGTEKLRSE